MKAIVLVSAALLFTTAAHAGEFDPAAGEKVFKKCLTCHAVGPAAKNKVGPILNGVVGRDMGSIEGFNYSKGREGTLMEVAKAGDGVWTYANLDAYLTNPKDLVPKGKMAFAGLKNETERHNVIAYLASHDLEGNTVDPVPVMKAAGKPD